MYETDIADITDDITDITDTFVNVYLFRIQMSEPRLLFIATMPQRSQMHPDRKWPQVQL